MNAFSTMTFANDTTIPSRAEARTAVATMGLGPNQLNWLRLNIEAFKQAEEQRRQMRHDAMRAAQIAGLA